MLILYRFCIFAKLTAVTLTTVSFVYCIEEPPIRAAYEILQ
ncbi:hypothetical protein EVA_22292 [gut metagenome]|uniref:Uncharacterized protein n=1 Tax=gut metagenome TaxID=749906 RepID=J9FJ13_9ZZZZ